jgi:hypothetical protein
MAMFKAYDTKVEVNGETVLSVVDGMGAFKDRALKILADCGIPNPAPGQWYPQQSWLNAFKKISDTIGPNTLYSIGVRIPENAKFPPQIDTVDKALTAIDMAYHMNHRNGEIGHYNFEKLGENSARVVCPNPYPCDFDRGIVEAMARKFKPAGRVLVVDHDEKAPCRKKGGDSCTYNVSW